MAIKEEINKIILSHPGPWTAIRLPQIKPPSAYVLALIGLPGSGKSTLAKAIHTRCQNAFYISGENITYAMFSKDKCSAEEYQTAYRWIYQAMDNIIEAGYSVIFDSTNNLRIYRRQLASRVETSAKLRFIELQASEDTLINRLTDRLTDHKHPQAIASKFNPQTFISFQNNYEPLDLDEGEKGIVINSQHTPLDEQLKIVDELMITVLNSPRPSNKS